MRDFVSTVWTVRWLVQRGLAAVYFVAFLGALNQFRPLLGERGLLPVPRFVARVPFREAPSLFHFHYSDRFFAVVAWTGIALSLLAFFGITEAWPLAPSVFAWLLLWVLYLSIVNVGQSFYAFGWESMLLEAGFFAAFLGPSRLAPSIVPVLALRWMLFRLELGAGLIKLRHDECWRRLECLYYHHETQPLPNPLSWSFHRLPKVVHRAGVAFSHFVQVVAPFGLFFPEPVSAVAGGLIVVHQFVLIVSGNYSWLNFLTVVIGATAFDDSALAVVLPIRMHATSAAGLVWDVVLGVLAGVTVLLSIRPALNLASKHQRMNYAYNPIHLVNDYGAFGSVTRVRHEIVLEGATGSEWREYEFRGKPGDPRRRPPQIAPYHLRLDWLMWFLPFEVSLVNGRVSLWARPRWFMQLVRRLLEGDRPTLSLLRKNPFPDGPPERVRAVFYRYAFTDRSERSRSGAWWTRERVGEYLPESSLEDLSS